MNFSKTSITYVVRRLSRYTNVLIRIIMMHLQDSWNT